MGDQSEYCSSMGAAVCTLLWRVSRQQDSVTSLLGGVCKCLVLRLIKYSPHKRLVTKSGFEKKTLKLLFKGSEL